MVNFKSSLLALVLVAAASAHVGSISLPSTFTVTSTSTLPITFDTQNGPITYEDFSVVVGFGQHAFSGSNLGDTILGNYDLVALGYSSTINDFTINVPLNTAKVGSFPSGTYTIAVAITSGIGAEYGAQLRFFSQTTQVTI